MKFKVTSTAIARAVICVVVCITTLFAGCRPVQIAAEAEVPRPLIQPLPIDVGVYYSDDFRKYAYSEDRFATKWKVALGAGHVRLMNRILSFGFRRVVEVKDPKALPADAGLKAVLEPSIEQYSFITPRDTGGEYFAVTIKYRLKVYAPDGQLADTLSFTGYGGAPAAGTSSGKPMERATRAAMRDAAAKFLIQFPQQTVAQRLRAGEPLIQAPPAPTPPATGEPAVVAEEVKIEAVPIIDTGTGGPAPAIPSPSPLPPTPTPTPTPTPASASAPAPAPASTPTAQPPTPAPATPAPPAPAPATQPPAPAPVPATDPPPHGSSTVHQ
jgi:hypothetical protein